MNEKEFMDHAIGKPWVNRAIGPSAYDCWGLVLASFKNVDGITLPEIDGYKQSLSTHAAALEGLSAGNYLPSGGSHGDIVCFYDSSDNFLHVGRMYFGQVLHAWGQGANGTGQVKWDRMSVLKRLFHRTEFIRYADPS